MEEAPEKNRNVLRRWLNAGTVGAVFLTVAVAVSLQHVLTVQKELFDPSMTIVRLAHWQLEMGYRDALQEVIDEYNRLHEKDKVKVIQLPVTEKVYEQWLNTHLVSGTAPDLSEMRMARMSLQGPYVAKFYQSMSDYIDMPNPYNAGTDLEGVAWRDTFIDGMRGGFNLELQDYDNAPTVCWTQRIFYNKKMLREATGSEEPPKTFGELMALCKAVRELGLRQGRQLIPIAGSKYSREIFFNVYSVPFTSRFESKLDMDMDTVITPLETYAAFQRGDVTFEDPAVKGYFECVKTLCDQFGRGFMGMDRDQAAFQFVQGQAAMISSGSWDANSLFKQARFDVGVMDFPLPARGERWGELISGRGNEAAAAGGGWYGIYKFSRNKKWALDFLMFLTSRKYNQQFNRAANWLPVIIGATPTREMAPFMPDPVGYSGGFLFRDPDIETKFTGQLWLFLQGETSYQEFSKRLVAEFGKPEGVDRVWATTYELFKDRSRNLERILAADSAQALAEGGERAPSDRYKRAFLTQVLLNNAEGYRYRYELQNHKPIPER